VNWAVFLCLHVCFFASVDYFVVGWVFWKG